MGNHNTATRHVERMKSKDPVPGEKLTPLLFRDPYCCEDNISTTPLDTILIARGRWSHCGEETLIEDGVAKRLKPQIFLERECSREMPPSHRSEELGPFFGSIKLAV